MDEETRKKLEDWNRNIGQSPLGKEAEEAPPEEPLPEINPIEEKLEKEREKSGELLSRIRTYEGDVANTVKKQKTSVSSIYLAQQKVNNADRKASGEARPSKRGAFFYLTLSLILILGGIGLLYGWYTFVFLPEGGSRLDTPSELSLVPANSIQEFIFEESLTKADLTSALKALKSEPPVSLGEIFAIYFVKDFVGPEGQKVKAPVSAREFLEKLEVNAALPLYRSLRPEFTYGIHQMAPENGAFLILKTTFYQNAFASMLDWEDFLAIDLPFITREPRSVVSRDTLLLASSTEESASTTETFFEDSAEDELARINVNFKDEVIMNHDARVLRDATGNIILLYSFADEETLIITDSVETLREIFGRFNLITFE